MSTHDVTPIVCPRCGSINEAATNVHANEPPKAGDITLCFGCTAVMMFDASLIPRACDEKTLNDGVRAEIERCRRAWRTVMQLKMGGHL